MKGLFVSRNGANVAKSDSVDGSWLYGRTLVRFRGVPIEIRVEVLHPREQAFNEATFEFGTQPPGAV